MRRNKGFTLIEVMVVLSILAIIAILAYNFFGSTMKEATESKTILKINNDLRVIAEAYEAYEMKTGVPAAAVGVFAFSTLGNLDNLVDEGVLKSIPSPSHPRGSADIYYGVDRVNTYYGDTAKADTGVEAGYVTNDICEAYNEKYTSLGRVVYNLETAGWMDGPSPAEGTFCWGDNSGANFYIVYRIYTDI